MFHFFKLLILTAVVLLLSADLPAREIVPVRSEKWFSEVVRELDGQWGGPLETCSVYADREGVVWCGTSKGLYALEGTEPRMTGLFAEKGAVISMTQLEDGDDIWVLTSGGLGRFSTVSEEADFYDAPSGEELRDFVRDSEGRLWISMAQGLISFSAESKSWGSVVSSGVFEDAQQIIADSKSSDTLWVCDSESGLIRFSISSESGEIFAASPRDSGTASGWNLTSLCQTSDGRIWAGGDNGILTVQGGESEWVAFQDEERYPGRLITAMSPNISGDRLWIGTASGGGLLSFDCNSSELVFYGKAIRPEQTQGSMSFRDVLVDKFGVLWMVTDEFGLLRTSSLTDEMEIYVTTAGKANSIFPGLVLGVFETENHILVHSSSGLASISRQKREVRRIRFGSISGRNALAMGRLSESTFLLVTPYELIIAKLHSRGKWERLDAFPMEYAEAATFAKCAENLDFDGRLWFSVNSELFRFDPGSSETVKVATLPSRVGAIHTDNRNVWVTNRGELHRFDASNGSQETRGLNQYEMVKSMTESDGDPHLWIATTNGLIRCNRETMDIERIPEVVKSVSSVCQGGEGTLWLVSKSGLKLFEIETQRFIEFPGRTELNSRPFHYQSVGHLENGRILAGGYGILLVASVESLRSKLVTETPRLRLGRVEILGEEEERELPVYGNQFPGEIQLKASDHGVRLHTMIPDYQLPSANRYEYRVDGGDWRRNRDGKVEISRIAKGKHTIEIRATSARGVSSGAPISLSLNARPRLWETAGFYVVISMLFLIAVVLHFRWRTRILSRSKEALEAVNGALADSEARYRSIVAGTTDAIVVTDKQFEIVACNPSAEKMVGARVGENFADFGVSPEVIPEFVEGLNDSGIHSHELLVKGCGGNIVRVDATVISGDAAASQWQFQMRDITRQVEWQERIREAQKMDAVGTLAGGIAHDFNNLLSPIAVHSKLSREALENDASAAVPGAINAFQICSDAVERAAELVHSLLRFARQTDEGAKVEDLVPAMNAVGRLLRGSVSSNIELDIKTGDRPARVFCSAQQFEQCLMNLVVNAGHAIGIGNGKIEVTLRRLEKGEALPQEAADLDGGIWCLEVSDDGEGMDEATRKRIFDPFFTTRAPGEGSGLGLSMVHSFAGEFGCGLEVESAPGEGTAFRVYFPEATPEDGLREETKVDDDSETKEVEVLPRRLLVVDDDSRVLLATTLILRKLGHEVVSKTDPVEALELFQSDQRFDLIITDQMMPEITGIRLAQKVHEINPEIPVILLTGFSQLMLEQGDHGEDISIVHMKPLDYAELNGSLERFSEPRALPACQDVALSS